MYWYFQFDKPDMTDLTIPVKSFLRQLATNPVIPGKIQEWLSSNLVENVDDLNVLIEQLHVFITELAKDIFIVLDGLDEFPDGGKETERGKMIDIVKDLAKKCYPNFHLLIASKNDADIRELLKEDDDLKDIIVEVDVTDGQQLDLEKFITTMMNHDKSLLKFKKETQDDIRERLDREKGKDK